MATGGCLSEVNAIFFSAVRNFDLEKVKYLVEAEGAEVHQHDEWDATPLFYASLTGQTDMVTYLLENGAQCLEKTFDGERCLYAALNSATRQALLAAKFRKGVQRKHPYLLFIEQLYDNEYAHPDVVMGGAHAHSFLLAARCPALEHRLLERQVGHTWDAQAEEDAEVMEGVVRWAYTGCLDAPHYCLPALQRLIPAHHLERPADDSDADLQSASEGVSLTTGQDQLRKDLQEALGNMLSAAREGPLPFSDIVLQAGGRNFHVHRAVLAARSEYFRAMLDGSFREAATGDDACVVLRDVSASGLEAALHWAYTDTVGPLPVFEDLCEAMQVADWGCMDGLMGRLLTLMQPHVTPERALVLLQTANKLGPAADRLADTCIHCLASHLLHLADHPLLAQLVLESAHSVEERQEVDSVPLVDDIRFHITKLHGDGWLSEDEQDEEGNLVYEDWDRLSLRQQKLVTLEHLLARLGLEG